MKGQGKFGKKYETEYVPKRKEYEEKKANDQDKTQKNSEISNLKFYDSKKNAGIRNREEFSTYLLRCFHNWTKAVLIKKYTDQIKYYYKSNFQGFLDISVLDIGCGNGGDVTKWGPNKIAYYAGVDTSKTGVENTMKRWQTYKTEFEQEKPFLDLISVNGAASEENFFRNINKDIYFDIVSSQFVLHYMFSKEKYVENLFNNISKRLLKNGFFICTIPDADAIIKKVKSKGVKNEKGEMVIGNQYYSIKFNLDQLKQDSPYGKEYGFFLADQAVGKQESNEDGQANITYVPEYLIMPDNFVKVAKKYDLELVEEKNFHSFCDQSLKQDKYYSLLKVFKIRDVMDIPEDLWEISSLYKIVAFKKASGLSMNEAKRNFQDLAQGKVVFQDEVEDPAEEQTKKEV